MSEKVTQEKSIIGIRNITLVISGVVVVIAVLAAIYFYMQYYQAQLLLKNPTLAAQEQTDQLLSTIGKLIQLPPAETPTIATVSDVSKLKNQPFFANAQNGDKVLIYTNAKEAILYRPSENKIIAVAPVNLGNQTTPTPTSTPAPSRKARVEKTPTPTPSSTQ